MKEANYSFFHHILCAFRKEGFARLKGMESSMPNFADRLKELRTTKGVTQKNMAELLGITERNYQRYEYGLVDPIASNTAKLADFLGVSIDYLLGYSDNPQRQ